MLYQLTWRVYADKPCRGVNDQKTNAMTLHTTAGVFLDANRILNSSITGLLTTSNCDVNAPNQANNAGCSIKDNSDLSFGVGFNKNGGGVYVTEWTSDFIKIWFFPRGQIPADIQSGSPTSLFTGNFDIDTHFKDLRLVFDTTFCGDFAGEAFSSSPTCASKAATCDEFVQNNPSAFAEAYWLVNSVRVFQDNGSNSTNSSSTTTVTSTVTTTARATAMSTFRATTTATRLTTGLPQPPYPSSSASSSEPQTQPYGHPRPHGRPPSRHRKRHGGAALHGHLDSNQQS
jgi:hypothetical protein